MQRKGPLPGKMFAWCILQRRFAGHFEYTGSISCQNQLILDTWRRYLAMKRRFYRPRLLRNASGRYFARMRRFVCPGCASRVLHSEGAPSPVQNEPRKCLVSAPQGFGVRCRPPTLPALRALAAAVLIARRWNRSPQNGARQDNGSFQCSLL